MTDGAIRREERGGKGRYVLPLADGQEAYLTFVSSGAKSLIVDYSFVPPAHRGRGLAVPLVARAVEGARAAGVTSGPLCG